MAGRKSPHQERNLPSYYIVLACGFAVQLSGVCFQGLVQLYVVNELNRAPSDFANFVHALRYLGIFLGVAFFGPLGSYYGTLSTLRTCMLVTMVALLFMSSTSFHVFKYFVALGSASSSLGMVQINTLIQVICQNDDTLKARVNMYYRLLAASGAILFPPLTAYVFKDLLNVGYGAAFVFSACVLGAAVCILSWACSCAAQRTSSSFSLSSFIAPYHSIMSSASARNAIFHTCLLNLPAHVVGVFVSSRFKEAGTTQQYQATVMSIGGIAALFSIFYAKNALALLSAPMMYTWLGLLNSIFIMGLGIFNSPHLLAAMRIGSTMATRASPVAHSVWMSEAVDSSLLSALFAVEKTVNCGFRSLQSLALGRLVLHFSVKAIFCFNGGLLMMISLFELYRNMNTKKAKQEAKLKLT